MSIEGEEYKRSAHRNASRIKQDDSKESYDNILIMESTESLVNNESKHPTYGQLEMALNERMTWSEVDDEDTLESGNIPKL